MADSTPIERLQPCLLDRLTDDEPTKQEEGRAQRVVSDQKYRRGVLRDLEWLFNTTAYLHTPGIENFSLADYPEAHQSVINFGTRQLCGLSAPDMDRLQREISTALRHFEPRISPQSIVVRADLDRNVVKFEVNGQLWVNQRGEHLNLKTIVDLETEQCLLADTSSHG